MTISIEDQVIDFYRAIFGQVFSDRFRPQITDRIRRDEVLRQVEAAADAASQSLTRFFFNEQLTETEAANILNGFTELPALLKLETIANSNIAPESVVKELLKKLPCPTSVRRTRKDAVYRVALHSIVQVLMFVARVMVEWQRLNFSSTFELPSKVIDQLNTISEQLNAPGTSRETADKRFELTYRDYLLQRFHRVEAGTVRMTTNMDVDLRELFVMPRVLVRPQRQKSDSRALVDAAVPMDLAAARMMFGDQSEDDEQDNSSKKKSRGVQALTQIKRAARNVIIGAPGSGKSTLFEWLQLKLASVEIIHVLGGEQAIPLLLRVRQLNPKKLPTDVALIEKAMGSKDQAALMPRGWLDRQMKAGRILFMLDGLDETEPELCDRYVIPWLAEMREKYPYCGYLISSRPVGYPSGALLQLGFKESDLLDFGEPEIAEYARHWCTAIRLAQNEPKEEARREGKTEGEVIVQDFQRNPYVKNLARNPLMLSAICLVNYFERGKLPEDRAVLYKLCVEGLLHHWDQRRGIHSEYTLDEKLRTCCEVALAMQADDRAEYEVSRVQRIFSVTLGDPDRAKSLLKHIRYRTGLLIERRAGMFAFAHLTFQEYLAAQAIYEGNRAGIDVKRLAQEYNDGRWKEVIALYCGLASANAARDMIKRLIAQPDTRELPEVLAEAYFSSGPKLSQDQTLRRSIIKRIAVAPEFGDSQLERFPLKEVSPIAHRSLGKIESNNDFSSSFRWMELAHSKLIDDASLYKRLKKWRSMSPNQMAELVRILHLKGTDKILSQMATDAEIYKAPGFKYSDDSGYEYQAELALMGLHHRLDELLNGTGITKALLQAMRVLSTSNISDSTERYVYRRLLRQVIPPDFAYREEFARLARLRAENLAKDQKDDEEFIKTLNLLADSLTQTGSVDDKPANKSKSKASVKRASKKRSKKV